MDRTPFSKDGAYLVPDSLCEYVGMRAESFVECLHAGTLQLAGDDSESQVCQIESKGRVQHWSDWVSSLEDTATVYKRYATRRCDLGVHLFNPNCSGPAEIFYEYYLWNRDPKSYYEAMDFCEEQGGQLYGHVESREDVQFILSQLGVNSKIWLGISDWFQEGVFLNLRGADLTKILPWSDGVPDNSNLEQHVIRIQDRANGLCDDSYPTDEYKFACQMIFSQLTEWTDESQVEVSATQTQVTQTRSCLNSSIGDPPECEGPYERVLTYLWNLQSKSWNSAKTYCESQSASLLYEVDGSLEQTQFLVSHMQTDSCFWLGLHLTQWGWANIQEQLFQSRRRHGVFLWANGEPSGTQVGQYAACMKADLFTSTASVKILFSDLKSSQLPFVCLKID